MAKLTPGRVLVVRDTGVGPSEGSPRFVSLVSWGAGGGGSLPHWLQISLIKRTILISRRREEGCLNPAPRAKQALHAACKWAARSQAALLGCVPRRW